MIFIIVTICINIKIIITGYYCVKLRMFFNSIEFIITPCSHTSKMGEHL